MDVWNTLMNTDAAYSVIEGFLQKNPNVTPCLDLKPQGEDGPNGRHTKGGTVQNPTFNIDINSDKLGRSKLEIGRTLLHEMIHSELARLVIQAGYYDHLEEFAMNHQGEEPFAIIWKYFDQ